VTEGARLRVVVVTFNNASFIERCVQAILDSEWTGDRDIVVVDNASTDNTADLVAARFPQVRLIRSTLNRGFGGGNNLALRDLEDVDFVALVNSDAFVTRSWLLPLRAALEADSGLGAAGPKVLFEPAFSAVRISSPTFVPGGGDDRELGVRVVGVAVDGGADVLSRCLFPSGWSWPEDRARWTTGDAVLWVPVTESANEIEVSVEGARSLRFPAGEHFDVINTLGTELTHDLRGRDIAYLEPDRGQRDAGGEIWGWCGAAVLLRAGYLRSVGLFDEAFFLYYEDTDLSWRGRNAGWRYVSVPTSVVRHAHAQSTDTASALFDYLNQRNRLMMVTRNGTWRQRGRAWTSYGKDLGRHAWGEVARPLVRGRRPHPVHTRRWARAGLAGAVRALRPPRSHS
jgi:GT2 family glycosyltransferase